MATLIWQKNKAFSKSTTAQSPRQIANKAYSLARKKLDRDEQRRRPQYDVRERLLLYTTMCKAEVVLDKSPHTRRRVKIADDDDILANQPYQPMAKPPPVLDLSPSVPTVTAKDNASVTTTQPVAPALTRDQDMTNANAPVNHASVPVLTRDCRVTVHHDVPSSVFSASILV